MKKLFFIISFLAISFFSFSQWSWINPKPQGNSFNSIYFTSSSTGYAVGAYGTVYKTTNTGDDWLPMLSGTANDLKSVFFTDANTGYAVGNGGTIIKTIDAGLTWNLLVSGVSNPLYSVYFTSVNTGFVVGASGLILQTVDGGENWNIITTGIPNTLNSVYFTSSTTGYIVGSSACILRTVDGGANWSQQYPGTATLYSVYFTSTSVGYAVGSSGTILKTSDAGNNWFSLVSETTASLRGVYFTTTNTGYIVGSSGYIGKTLDAGNTWSAQTAEPSILYSLFFVNSNLGFIAGNGGAILKTTNAGQVWTSNTNGINSVLYSICFSDDNNGLVVGANGTIAKTTNGGTQWLEQASITNQTLRDIFSINGTDAVAVGDSGTIIKTTNAGISWSKKTSGIVSRLSSVYFINSSLGYAVGDLGVILITNDGGDTWATQNSGVTNNLTSVFFTDNITGFIVGSGGILLRTIDGYTWGFQTILSGNNLTAITFIDSYNGFAVGSSGKIFNTSDGGINWSTYTASVVSSFQDVFFTDLNTGFVVGSGGFILKTIDGGLNWYQELSGTSNSLYSVSFVNSNIGFTVGTAGTILKNVSGGCPEITQNPVGAEVCSGALFNLSVTATGTFPLNYQWKKDGVDVFGATSDTYSDNSWNYGTYTCVVSNSCGSVTSNAAIISQNYAPSISISPVNSTIGVGGNFSALVNVGYSKNNQFQWYKNGGLMTGNFGCSLEIIGATYSDAGTYQCQVSNSCGTAQTNTFDLNIIAAPASEWDWLNPLPQGNNLYASYFINSSIGFVVGYYGTILKTTNGGNSWVELVRSTTSNLQSILFTDSITGYIAGVNGIILKTTDAGNSWTVKSSGSSSSLNSIYFVNSSTGYICGSYGTVLKTVDAGETWSEILLGPSTNFYTIYFINSNIGFVTGNGGSIYKTNDAGVNWTLSNYGGSATLQSVFFTDVNTGFAVGSGGTIIKTLDAGNSWNIMISGTISSLYSIKFSDSNTGYIDGSEGAILKTVDGGNSWTQESSGTSNLLRSIEHFGSNSLIAVGNGGDILVNNTGTWVNSTTKFTSNSLREVFFTNSSTGYIVGDDGFIIKTTNGGTAWNNLNSGTTKGIRDIYFIDLNTGFAVGDTGLILKTTNAGINWNVQNSGTTINLASVSFPSASVGYVVGNYGVMLKTTDGGNTWSPLTTGVSGSISSVFFTSVNSGFFTYSYNIFSTFDGGINWSIVPNGGSTSTLLDIYFKDANNGYAVGSMGTLLRTFDGGYNWDLASSGTINALRKIYFYDSNNGYIAGSGGTVIYTTNGGTNWIQYETKTSGVLFSVCFPSLTLGYALGTSGTILKYGTACTTPQITQNPTSQTDCAGGNTAFSVTATGTDLVYQWKKNGTDISGATNSSYAIIGVAALDAGNYQCIVSNSCGSDTSIAGVLTVNVAPSITLQPASQTLCEGDNFEVSVTVSGTSPIMYQWLKNSSNISGQTNNSYSISGVSVADAGAYTCYVSNVCGNLTSITADFIVNTLPVATITPNGATTFCEGGSVILNANILAGLSYQWLKDGADITGETNSFLSVNSTGSYSVIVNNSFCSNISANQNVTVDTLPTVNGGNDVNTCIGQEVTLTASGSAATYTWSNGVQNGVAFTPVGGTYYVTATNTGGCENVDSVIVTVSAVPVASFSIPSSAYPNTNVSISYTGNALSNAIYNWNFGGGTVMSGSGQGPYQVKWTTTGQKLVTLTVIQGGCSSDMAWSTIDISNMPTADFTMADQLCGDSATVVTYSGNASAGATYNWNFGSAQVISGSGQGPYVIYWENDGNYVVSLTVVETGNTSLPVYKAITVFNNSTITVAGNTELCAGNEVVLYAPGANNLQYQWQFDGVNIPGAVNSFLTVNTQGNYSVVITKPSMSCTITSQPVNIIVHATGFNLSFNADHTQDTQPPFDFIFNNTTPNLVDYNFTWMFGDGSMLNSNGLTTFHTYDFNGTYTVDLIATHIASGCKDTLTQPSYIACYGGTANNFTASISPPGPAQICIGDSILLQVNAPTAQTYQWYNGFSAIIGATSDYYYAKQPGDYRAYVTNGTNNVYTNVFTLLLKPSILPQIYANGQLTACAHDTIQLSLNINYVSYEWSGGQSTATIDVLTGGYYNVTVTDIYNCTLSPTPYFVNSSLVDTPNICMVLVDSTLNKNLIVWEKPVSDLIESYRIYKMNSSAQYVPIGLVPYQNLSQFVDVNSNPAAESNWYKLSVIDTCGNESVLSDFHRTLHLMVNPAIPTGFSLDWQMDYYGFDFTTYNLYRKYADGTVEMFHQVPFLQTSYTDANPPAGVISYFVSAVKLGGPCSPTGAKDMSGPFSQSLSNIEDNGIIISAASYIAENGLNIYPNPAKDKIIIEIIQNADVKAVKCDIINAAGQIIRSISISERINSIDIQDLSSGFYTIRILSENGIVIKKMIKQ